MGIGFVLSHHQFHKHVTGDLKLPFDISFSHNNEQTLRAAHIHQWNACI